MLDYGKYLYMESNNLHIIQTAHCLLEGRRIHYRTV